MRIEQDRSDFSNSSTGNLSKRYFRYKKILERGKPPQNEIELTREFLEEENRPYDNELLKKETLKGIKEAMVEISRILEKQAGLN